MDRVYVSIRVDYTIVLISTYTFLIEYAKLIIMYFHHFCILDIFVIQFSVKSYWLTHLRLDKILKTIYNLHIGVSI